MLFELAELPKFIEWCSYRAIRNKKKVVNISNTIDGDQRQSPHSCSNLINLDQFWANRTFRVDLNKMGMGNLWDLGGGWGMTWLRCSTLQCIGDAKLANFISSPPSSPSPPPQAWSPRQQHYQDHHHHHEDKVCRPHPNGKCQYFAVNLPHSWPEWL